MVGDGPWNPSPLREDYLDDPKRTKLHKRKHLFSNLGSPQSQSKLLQLTLSQQTQSLGAGSPLGFVWSDGVARANSFAMRNR